MKVKFNCSYWISLPFQLNSNWTFPDDKKSNKNIYSQKNQYWKIGCGFIWLHVNMDITKSIKIIENFSNVIQFPIQFALDFYTKCIKTLTFIQTLDKN